MSGDEEVFRIFKQTGALLEGHFVLRSGLHSPCFFQCARVCERLDHVTRLAELLRTRLPVDWDFSTVLAPAMGGLVIGQEVARQSGSRYLFVEKVNGELALRRNFQIHPEERILVVEDVITRGGRVNETLDIVAEHGGVAVGVALLVDRSEGQAAFPVPYVSLLELSFPTYPPDQVPEELAAIPVQKPGS